MSRKWSRKGVIALSACVLVGVTLITVGPSLVNRRPDPSPFSDEVWAANYWNEATSGRYHDVLAILNEAEKTFPNDPELLQQKCSTLILNSKQKEALSLLPKLLRSRPEPGNHLVAAFTYYANGLYKNVIEESTLALQEDKRSWRALGMRAMARYRLKEYGPALTDAEEGLRFANEQAAGPIDVAQFYSLKALAFRGLGRYQNAIDTCAAGLELDPRGSAGEMQSVMGTMYRLSGDPVKANNFALQAKIFGWTEEDRMLPYAYSLAAKKDQQRFATRIDTEHLIFFGDQTEDEIIRLAINGEVLIKMYEKHFVPLTVNYPFSVYNFETSDAMAGFLKETKGISRCSALGLTSLGQHFIATGDHLGPGTFAHELMHKVLGDRYSKLPDPWAEEGIPELMEKFYGYIDGDKCVVFWGQQNPLRLDPADSEEIRKLNLSRIVTRPNTEDFSGSIEAQRLASVFLYKCGNLQPYLKTFDAAVPAPFETRFEAAFGKSFAEIEPRWRELYC